MFRRNRKCNSCGFTSALFALVVACTSAHSQALVEHDEIPFSGLQLELRRYAQLPLEPDGSPSRVAYLTHAPGDDRLFVATHGVVNDGISTAKIHVVDPDSPGGPSVSPFLFLGSFLDLVNGPDAGAVEHTREGGLRTMAFHPDFDVSGAPGYRKFYTMQQEQTASGAASLPYLGPTDYADISDSVVGEWTVDADGNVDVGSYREVFRVALPWYTHPGKQVGFNPLATPGDEDYGMMYIGHGDAGVAGAGPLLGTGQNLDDARGKILRINPLQDGSDSYTVPDSNPFTAGSDPADAVLDEIYALGFRSPHRFTWARDSSGETHMISSDIGQDNVEEINLIVPGGNYGWRDREGTYEVINFGTGNGIGVGIDDLPANDSDLNDFIYPAAQYGHEGSGPPRAVAGGVVIQNSSDPEMVGQYVFSDFPVESSILHVSVDDLVNAKTTLDLGEIPDQLAPATIEMMGVLFDDDNDPLTPSITTSLKSVIQSDPDYEGGERTEAFFYQGPRGELYVTNKRNRWIYLVTNSVNDLLAGDYNDDGVVDAADYTVWRDAAGAEAGTLPNDTDGGVIGSAQYATWRNNYGSSDAPTELIPEPASLVLLVICGVAGQSRLARRPRYPVASAWHAPRL